MRFSRILGLVALVGVVALGAAWRVSASQGSPRPRAAGATTRTKLQRELQQVLRRGRVAPLLPSGPGACFVAGGSCSLKPCVVLIGGRPAAAAATSSAVALAPPPRAQTSQTPSFGCQGRPGTPQTFKVSTEVSTGRP
jgi:hypothetical protein